MALQAPLTYAEDKKSNLLNRVSNKVDISLQFLLAESSLISSHFSLFCFFIKKQLFLGAILGSFFLKIVR